MIAEASLLHYASADFPPTVLIHGTADRRQGDASATGSVAHQSSLLMYHALEAAGATVELHLLAGLHHAFDVDPGLAHLCVTVIDSLPHASPAVSC